jgi:hypothetical protein
MSISTMPVAASRRIRIAPQTNIRTTATANARELNFYEFDYSDDEPFAKDRLLGGGFANLVDQSTPGPGLRTVSFTVKVPVDTSQFPFWLSLALGGKATSGTAPNFIHAMTTGVRALISNTVEIEQGPGIFDTIQGVVVQRVTLSMSPSAEGWQTADITCIGRLTAEGAATSAMVSPVIVPMGDRLSGTMGTMLVDAVAFGAGLDGTITLENSIVSDRYFDGTNTVSEMTLTDQMVDFALNARLTTDAATRALGRPTAPARISPARVIEFNLTSSANRLLKFTLPAGRFARAKTTSSGPGGMTVALAASAEKTAVLGAMQVEARSVVPGAELW